MGRDTNIEWCDSTSNGSSGCDGCELWSDRSRLCYAGTLHEGRLAKSLPALYAGNFRQVREIAGRFARAASWSDLRGTDRPGKPWLNGRPRFIFVGDMGDTFSRGVSDDYLERELRGAMLSPAGRRHFWLLLTKRPRRLAALSEQWDGLPDNCMAMTTATDQRTAVARLRALRMVRARWKGVSAEPLLGRVSLREAAAAAGVLGRDPLRGFINWVVAGGASGRDATPANLAWAQLLRDECAQSEVDFLWKQWGAWMPAHATEPADALDHGRVHRWPDGSLSHRVPRALAGRVLDGQECNGVPFPTW